MTKQETCKDRVRDHYRSRMRQVEDLWGWYRDGHEESHPEHQTIWTEYGLSFDYVPGGTFADQPIGYFRYQLSWGGPSDEFRFFCDPDCQIERIEYWFMDWFDGAKVRVTGKALDIWGEIWDDWRDAEILEAALKTAKE